MGKRLRTYFLKVPNSGNLLLSKDSKNLVRYKRLRLRKYEMNRGRDGLDQDFGGGRIAQGGATKGDANVKDDAKLFYEIVLFAPKALLVFQANKSQPRFSLTLDTTLSQPNSSSPHPSITADFTLLKNSPCPAQQSSTYCSSWKTYSTSALPNTFHLQSNIPPWALASEWLVYGRIV